MLRKAPPLESVEIFIAAARGGSFRGVARDLALSPSAISRRIAALEDFLGARLFDRSGPLPVLSKAGRRYLDLVEPGLRSITEATEDLARPQGGRLRVATSHSFASTWLLPRLPALLREAGVDVELVIGGDFDSLRSNEADVGIWGGRVAPEELNAERLFDVSAVPVCTGRLVHGGPPLGVAEDLANVPLVAVSRPRDMWKRWLGVPPKDVRTFETLQIMYEAAAAGLGVALAVPLLSETFLASGRLRVCADEARPLGLSYDLYRPTARSPRAAERIFAEWLHDRVRKSLDFFDDHRGRLAC